MIPVIEDYLSELIESKFNELKANPSMLANILSTSQSKLTSLQSFIQSANVPVTLGYPRPNAEMPVICILLSTDDEEQMGLGDTDGDEVDIQSSTATDTLTLIDQPGAKLAVPYVQTNNPSVLEIHTVVNASLGITLDPSEYELENSDEGLIGFYTSRIDDGDTIQVTYDYATASEESVETKYSSNFRIEVWSTNGVLTAQLYALLKWVFISGRGTLVGDGLFRQKLGGTDLMPAPQYFPAFVYRRAMTLYCEYVASTPDDNGSSGYITGVTIDESLSI